MDEADAQVSEALSSAANSFSVDQVTAEATAALAKEAIDSIVLKGPGIATWLYRHDEPRLYRDSDLLIRQADWASAGEIVEGLGYRDALGHLAHPRMESGEGHLWIRLSDQAEVDLHSTIIGLSADPDEVWRALKSGSDLERVGGRMVRTPSHAARLLHIVLHAEQHGDMKRERPMRDLERALEIAERETWNEAAELAQRLDGIAAFSAGLALLPAGNELAVALGLLSEASVEAGLRLGDVALSEGFAELSRAPGTRAKLWILLREAFPRPTFMRWWSRLARRGLLGLVLSYPWRLIWLLYRAPPGYRAWRHAARDVAGDGR